MEKLRRHLGINRWAGLRRFMGQCFGFGLRRNAPAKCQRLNFARHIYSAARRTVWFYQEGASWLFPDLWEDLSPPYRRFERGDIISAYYRRLPAMMKPKNCVVPKRGAFREAKTLSMNPDDKRVEVFSDYKFALAFARIESHYLLTAVF